MSKLRQKKTNYNEEIIKALIEKYGFKRDYIYKSIRGERVGTYPLKIQEEYKRRPNFYGNTNYNLWGYN